MILPQLLLASFLVKSRVIPKIKSTYFLLKKVFHIITVNGTPACKSCPFPTEGFPERTSSKVHVNKYPWAASQAKGLPGQRKGRESLLPDSQRRMKDCPDWQWVTEGSAESLLGSLDF